MELTEFDQRYAWHQIRSLTAGWPFVERHDPAGYPRSYRPLDVADSLAFEAVNKQDPIWPWAKFHLAGYYQSRGEPQRAFAEYRGLMRDQPENATVRLYAADVLVRLKDLTHARELFERAYALEPSAMTCYGLGRFELMTAHYDRAVSLLEQSLKYRPDDPQVLFGLSRGYALKRDGRRARAYADRLAQVNPGFSGLHEWQAELAELP
jgi:predicted Zn-dependent protease